MLYAGAGLAWILAFGLFVLEYGPMLVRVRRPRTARMDSARPIRGSAAAEHESWESSVARGKRCAPARMRSGVQRGS